MGKKKNDILILGNLECVGTYNISQDSLSSIKKNKKKQVKHKQEKEHKKNMAPITLSAEENVSKGPKIPILENEKEGLKILLDYLFYAPEKTQDKFFEDAKNIKGRIALIGNDRFIMREDYISFKYNRKEYKVRTQKAAKYLEQSLKNKKLHFSFNRRLKIEGTVCNAKIYETMAIFCLT